MASHVRSSLQQVIDTLRWIHTTDEEQLSVALSRLPIMERRDFLSRIQDAVYTSHSHVTNTSAAEATYLDSPAFRQEPPLHSSRNWADMSSDPLPQSTDPSTTWHPVRLVVLANVATARRIHWTLTSSAPTQSILAKSATNARKSSLDPSQAAEMTQAMAGGQTAGALAGTAAGMAAGVSDRGDFLRDCLSALHYI